MLDFPGLRMNLKRMVPVCAFLASVLCGTLFAGDAAQEKWNENVKIGEKLEELRRNGNWKELRIEAQKQLDAMNPDDESAGARWRDLCTGLFQGNEIELYDEMFEKYAAGKFARNVAFFAYGPILDSIPGYGIILDGKFKRGPNRGNAGRPATSRERDRAQLLRLMSRLIPEAENERKTVQKDFFNKMAAMLLQNRNSGSSYKLQALTDLEKLPDYSTDEGHVSSMSRPPVNPDGSPVFYRIPASWDAAASDGERLRFVLSRADNDKAKALWAVFLCGQFDFLAAGRMFREEYYMTPAMRQYLYELKDNETIAELADGIRKITLPDDCNYIGLYKQLKNHYRLGMIYASRMQFEKAAEEFGKDTSVTGKQYAEQILGSWGMPENLHVFPAGTELTIPYHFRNAEKVTVRLYRVDMDKAVERMLKTAEDPNSFRLDIWSASSLSSWNLPGQTAAYKNLCRDLIGEKPEKELTFDLHPLPHHWETTEYLKFGTMAPGAFVAEFVPAGNEESRAETLVWASDLALTVESGARNGRFRLFLNDPASGRPVPGVKLKIFSYYHNYGKILGVERQKITPEVLTFETGADGIAEFHRDAFKPPEQSSVAARYILAETSHGKLTLRSHPLYYSYFRGDTAWNERPRIFMITDKPVYKPGDAIAFTGYLRQPSYGGKSGIYEGKTVTLKFYDPQHKEAFRKEIPFDAASQSFTCEMKLPADAMLGMWQVYAEGGVSGSIGFKVEEYRKPEYLLTVAPPAKPVKAGEKIPVTMEAKYYFGAPVAEAEISYRIFRSETAPLYPFSFVWNWLYGERYAVCTTSWQNEEVRNVNYGKVLIRSGKGKTDAAGKLTVEIDSADAVAKFGEKDFSYSVEAEVKDSTNRVVSGSGSVIAAVKPFRVFIYSPWGFAKTGERRQLEIKACTPDGQNVSGTGVLRIFRRALNADGVPARTGAALKTIRFVPGGPEKPEFILNEEGVYELDAEVVSDEGVSISETMPVFAVGEKQGDSLFGEYPMSVSTDKPTYRPGETAQILVTCDKPGRTVYFITRSERGAAVQCVTLEGYSRLFRIPVEKDDQPNFFVDVMSYQDGRMLTLRKQIAVPPEKKVLNVKAEPAAEKVRPGTDLPLKIAVTGLDGKPVSGNVTVAVYDKSLEAVQRSPVPAICQFFWSWIRHASLSFVNNFVPVFGRFPEMRNIEDSFAIFFRSDDNGGIRYEALGRGRAVKMSKSFAPAAAQVMALNEAKSVADAFDSEEEAGGGAPASEDPANAVRTNFLDRAFWAGCVTLPESGEMTVRIPVPDNLTTWVVRVWSLTSDTRVGEARTEIVVSKDLIARLELPRFMVQGDTVYAVVTLNNTTDRDLGEAETSLTAPGLLQNVHTQTVALKANGSASYQVPLTASGPGEYTLTLSAKAGKESDALELELPVLVKGIDKQVNTCGRLDARKTKAVITLDIPEKRKPETTAFALHLSPGAAKNMVELLPYLAADDSGDVFGLVNRFLPALSAKLALRKLGVRWEDVAPEKTARDPLYSEYMRRYSWNGTAVPSFTAEDFDRVAAESLGMIRKMVNSDGGWGWFGAYREVSWPDTTAYVTEALLELNDRKDAALIRNAAAWLERYAEKRVEEIRKEKVSPDNTDCLVVRVLAKAGKPNKELMNFCYRDRADSLSPYGYAMLALAYGKDSAESEMLIRNLEQFLKADDENGTAYLNIPSACCFFWYGSENETLSAYLELLLRDDPESVTAQKVANYLVTNVRNSPWRNSTRALGAAVRALANYILVSGEGNPDFTVTVRDGSEVHHYTFNAKNMWKNDGPALFLPAEKLKAGKRSVELEFSGTGALYWNGMLNYFSLEDRIEPAGLEMKIKRNYYLLVQDADASALLAGRNGAAVKEGVLKYKRVPLKDGDTVKPGDMVEVELISTAKNDYDYVVLQDSMPAGFEYVNPSSGWMWNWTAPMYAEYKERGAKFFLRSMARGDSNAFYRIRAQLPGTVTALPARGYGIYAPELKCNGAQQTMKTVK